MEKIALFFESNTWKIIRCVLFMALFVYLTIMQIAQLPGTKHVVYIVVFVFGFFKELVDLVKILKARHV